MKEIKLPYGQVAIVDDCDYERVSMYRWGVLALKQKNRTVYYARTYIKREGRGFDMVLLHTMILGKHPNGLDIDHKNGDRMLNTRDNLRFATRSHNLHNKKKSSNCTSKYRGVSWSSLYEKWESCLSENNKTKHLGKFLNEKDAAKAYDVEAKRFHGEFAVLNFPRKYRLRTKPSISL